MTARQLQQINDGNKKCIKVIDSCQNLDQLYNAGKLSNIFCRTILQPMIDKIPLLGGELKEVLKMASNLEKNLLELLELKKIQLKNKD